MKKTALQSIQNKFGFSLAELAVALGILSLVALGSLTTAKMLADTTSRASAAEFALGVTSQVREQIKYTRSCRNSLTSAAGVNDGNMNLNTILAGDQQIEMLVNNTGAGVGGNDTIIRRGQFFPSRNLAIADLRLVNALEVNTGSGNIVAQVSLGLANYSGDANDPIGSFAYKTINLGTVQFQLVGNSIDDCTGVHAEMTDKLCVDMGCEWDTDNEFCQCKTVDSMCDDGEYAVSFFGVDDVGNIGYAPECKRLGEETGCPDGQLLESIGIERQVCKDLPVVSTTDASSPVPPDGGVCRCYDASTDGQCSSNTVFTFDHNVPEASCTRNAFNDLPGEDPSNCFCEWVSDGSPPPSGNECFEYQEIDCQPYGSIYPSDLCENSDPATDSVCWVELFGPNTNWGCSGSDVPTEVYSSQSGSCTRSPNPSTPSAYTAAQMRGCLKFDYPNPWDAEGHDCEPANWTPQENGVYVVDTCGCFPGGDPENPTRMLSGSLVCNSSGKTQIRITSGSAGECL